MGILKNSALADRRKHQRYSQMEIARKLGVSQSTYWAIETGYREPTPEERTKIAALLRTHPVYIFPR